MKKNDIILITCSAAVLLLLSAGTLLGPKPVFSENENRYLQKQPEISVSAITEGRFEKQAEAYLADHIAGRESWITASSRLLSLSGVTDINGTYLCTDGRLVQKVTEKQFNREAYRKNLQQIAGFRSLCAKKKIPVTLIAVPTAASVYRDRLPAHAVRFDENSAFAYAEKTLKDSFLDLRKTLSDRTEGDTFFRTDHHWSGYGAYRAYCAFQDFTARCADDTCTRPFNPRILTSDFRGTLYSRVLLPETGTDTIEAPKEDPHRPLTVTADGKKRTSIYVPEHLEKKDKYAVYFGGNCAQTDIFSENSTSGESILVLKDSFANSFVPYLTEHYENITMIDTRYYQGDIASLAGSFDRVLFLYSITSLSEQKLHLTQTLLQ